MNRTSCSLMLDRMAARSPACWMAGPLVTRSGAESWWAMIIAIVVLPRPGGPDISTWSGVRPRATAASSISDSCSRTRSWPMSSSRVRGRRAASNARSSGVASPITVSGSMSRSRSSSMIRPSRACAGRRAAGSGRRHRRRDGRRAATVSTACSASRLDQPRPWRASRTWSRQAPPPVPTEVTGEPTRSLSSTTIRSAPLRPMPGTAVRAAWSDPEMACRSRSGVRTASIACATLGPTPLAVWTSSNMSRSSTSAKP